MTQPNVPSDTVGVERAVEWITIVTDVVNGLRNGRPLQRLADEVRDTYEPGEPDPWWYDNTAHLLSGVLLGSVLLSLGGTMLAWVGYAVCVVVWEWFEWSYNIRPWDEREDWSFDRAVEDTLLDSVFGFAGLYLVLSVL